MPLESGQTLAHYQIDRKLGEGGMGEVWAATDTRLHRPAAIKALPASVAGDPERLARFKREAQVLAALSHPNIAAIYGLEEMDGAPYLAMELVEGDDLSTRIDGHALPVDEAVDIALQIAAALEEAHEKGIVHRDLKPANIKVTPDGKVKVLDFGLAKAIEGDRSDSGTPGPSDRALTMTSPAMTQMGMILGTAAYMAPEQARGRAVDRRADIWAFGVILFEMLTGRRLFEGADVSVTLASVIKDAPDWNTLPADLPASVRRVLRRCLEKDPRQRLSSIGDARLDLEERDQPVVAGTATSARPRAGSTIQLIGTALGVAAVAVAATLWLSGALSSNAEPIERLTVLAPPGQSIFVDATNQAISPDGRHVAFLTGLAEVDTRLWIRTLDDLTAREVEDSAGAQLPFWSFDGQTLAFFARGKLWTVPATGGRPQVLADAPDGRGGTWSKDGVVLFAPTAVGSLSQVSANGGRVTEVTELDTANGETGHRFPEFLPDGRHFLYAGLPAPTGLIPVYLGALDSPDRRKILTAESTPVYAEPGFLLYSRRGVLVAHPFDPSTLEFTGEAQPLGDMPGELNVNYSAGRAVSVTRTGVLTYLSAAQQESRLAWLDQSGREVGTIDVEPGPYISVAVSPDGRNAIVTKLVAPEASLWWVDLERGGLSPLSNTPGWNAWPVWSPDGTRVLFGSDREGPIDIYVRAVGASEDEVFYRSSDLFKFPASWAPSGVVVFWVLTTDAEEDLWTVAADGKAEPELFVRTPKSDVFGRISPDGRWMAYISAQSGQLEAYVQPFPGPGAARRVTTTGTSDYGLWWGQDSRQLLILGADLQLLLVDISTTPELSAGTPRAIGRIPFVATNGAMDATPDLKRLLAIVPEQSSGYRSITVLRNWLQLVR
jgi:Tol biopolymer transport system component